MKKVLSLLLLTVLLVSLFSCGNGGKKAEAYLGLGYEAMNNGISSTSDNGVSNLAFIAAAVVVDTDGKVLSIDLDAYVGAVGFDNLGQMIDGRLSSMNSMASSSSFAESVATVATAVAGKTASEITALAAETEAEDVVAMMKAVAKAADTAESPCGKTDKPGVALAGNLTATSADALAGTDGSAKSEIDFAAVALDADGKVSGAALDSITVTHTFNASGTITLPTSLESKREKGDAYNMKPASGIKKEWFEQAEGFCDYLRGKTATEIGAIGVEGGYPTEDALLSSCTMAISGYITVAVAAATAAAAE